MSIQSGTGTSSGYFARLALVVSTQTTQLVRSPAQPNRAEAARRLKRNVLTVAVAAAGLIATLMIWVDAWEISQMPPRGTAGLGPFRILTDFGKDTNVLALTAVLLLAVAFVAPAMHGPSRRWLLAIGIRLQYVLFALAVPLFIGEILKWIVGRGRPFVGASPFDFVPFAGTESHFSFPSAHAITAVALAFAVAAIWPRLRGLMIAYALLIIVTRLVLLAHHPSDVVAGATIGMIGAMCVRYWFAARGLGFAVGDNGIISPVALKGVAAGPSEP
jgi:undecaprenyl-diphosphatase